MSLALSLSPEEEREISLTSLSVDELDGGWLVDVDRPESASAGGGRAGAVEATVYRLRRIDARVAAAVATVAAANAAARTERESAAARTCWRAAAARNGGNSGTSVNNDGGDDDHSTNDGNTPPGSAVPKFMRHTRSSRRRLPLSQSKQQQQQQRQQQQQQPQHQQRHQQQQQQRSRSPVDVALVARRRRQRTVASTTTAIGGDSYARAATEEAAAVISPLRTRAYAAACAKAATAAASGAAFWSENRVALRSGRRTYSRGGSGVGVARGSGGDGELVATPERAERAAFSRALEQWCTQYKWWRSMLSAEAILDQVKQQNVHVSRSDTRVASHRNETVRFACGRVVVPQSTDAAIDGRADCERCAARCAAARCR